MSFPQVRSSREELVQLQDVKDTKIRGYLQKACDTSSASERAAAIKILLSTILSSRDRDQ